MTLGRIIFSAGISLLIQINLPAQGNLKDIPDHPLVSRYEGSEINRYTQKEFESFSYPVSPKLINYNKLENSQTVEGNLTFIEYVTPAGVTALQVFRTYQTQLAKAGFKSIFSCKTGECGDMPMHFVRDYVSGSSTQIGNSMVGQKGAYLVVSGTQDDKSYIVSIVVGDDKRQNAARYAVNIIQVERLDTDKVDVASVTDQINLQGRYAFYGIHFDTNSAVLNETSKEALDVLADYLRTNPLQKVLIVGHTDNTGDFSHNMTLSLKRAESVISKLSQQYSIDSARMTPVGIGMASPLSSNANEDGRAMNRRVELVVR